MRRVLALVGVLLTLPAASEPPAALIEETEEAVALCTRLGGTPAILDGYRVTRELNGDGTDDFLTDLARLECAGAWSAFCGSSGCPASAWLSESDGGHVRFDFGRLLGLEVRNGSPLPSVVARYATPFCADSAEECTRSWTFASNSPETPPMDRAAAVVAIEPAPRPEPAAAPDPVPGADAGVPGLVGWTLRHVPGSSPVALGMGTGDIASLAIFCLSDQPFLAVTFHNRPEAEIVDLSFAFSQGPVTAAAGFEETAGGAFVASLADGPLAARLAGRDSEVPLRVGPEDEGILSLKGSSRAIHSAIAACHAF